jgi:hypothetical protein
MYIHVAWTKFAFKSPQETTEAQYALARERPDELHRSARAQVRATAPGAVTVTILTAAAAAGCFWLSGLFDSTNTSEWQSTLSTCLVMVGCALVLSALFTAGSFLHYAAAAIEYWRALTRTARGCASYSDFVAAWTHRQETGIGADRKLPWWLSWLILAGVLLAGYVVISWYSGK